MINKNVCIVDYGIGNLFSVARSLEVAGANVTLSSERTEIENADRLVLPGVGAFGAGIASLRSLQLEEAIIEFCSKERPILGICLGMQFLATSSEEFGCYSGLNLVPGVVRKLNLVEDEGMKVPHVGWTPIERPSKVSWDNTIFEKMPTGEEVYVVHSYHFVPSQEEHRLAETFYGKTKICIAVKNNQVTGCQFHPEKSGRVGISLLEEFIC